MRISMKDVCSKLEDVLTNVFDVQKTNLKKQKHNSKNRNDVNIFGDPACSGISEYTGTWSEEVAPIGAATLSPLTFFAVCDDKRHRFFFTQRCFRSDDFKIDTTEDPDRTIFNEECRSGLHHQFQIVLKPFFTDMNPYDEKIGLKEFIRILLTSIPGIDSDRLIFRKDTWRSFCIGAYGSGYEVSYILDDGEEMELAQATVFDRIGNRELARGDHTKHLTTEITIGIERLTYIADGRNRAAKTQKLMSVCVDDMHTWSDIFSKYERNTALDLKNHMPLFKDIDFRSEKSEIIDQDSLFKVYDDFLWDLHFVDRMSKNKAFFESNMNILRPIATKLVHHAMFPEWRNPEFKGYLTKDEVKND